MKKVMKAVMWILAAVPLLMTLFGFQALPDRIPVHFDISWRVDRWGSRYLSFLIPVMIIAFTILWSLLIRFNEKKAEKTEDEKEKNSLLSNASVIGIISIATTAFMSVIQYVVLNTAYKSLTEDVTQMQIDMNMIISVAVGALFIVLGNYLPKTRRNGTVGFRMTWTRYNDVTWAKSNRFCGITMMAAGLVIIVFAMFERGMAGSVIIMACLGVSLAASIIYAYNVYRKEIEKENE